MTPKQAQEKLKNLTEGAVKGSKYTITGIARELKLSRDTILNFKNGKNLNMDSYFKIYNYLKGVK